MPFVREGFPSDQTERLWALASRLSAVRGGVTGPLETALLAALISDEPLPPSPAGAAELGARIAAAADPPTAITHDPPPRALVRGGAEPRRLGGRGAVVDRAGGHPGDYVGGTPAILAVGLDSVPRIMRGISLRSDPRHPDTEVAPVGCWIDGVAFTAGFDTIDRIDAGTITFDVTARGVDGDIHERTLLAEHAHFHAAEPWAALVRPCSHRPDPRRRCQRRRWVRVAVAARGRGNGGPADSDDAEEGEPVGLGEGVRVGPIDIVAR